VTSPVTCNHFQLFNQEYLTCLQILHWLVDSNLCQTFSCKQCHSAANGSDFIPAELCVYVCKVNVDYFYFMMIYLCINVFIDQMSVDMRTMAPFARSDYWSYLICSKLFIYLNCDIVVTELHLDLESSSQFSVKVKHRMYCTCNSVTFVV